MNLTLMALGNIKFYSPMPGFDTPGFDTVERDSQFSWTQQGRLSRSPAMQFTGSGEDVIVIAGKMFPNQFGGISTLEALRAAGQAGKPLMLQRFYPLEDEAGVRGDVIGRFGIKRVRHSEARIGINGVAHKMDFTIELTAFGEDPGSSMTSNQEFTFV